MAGFGRRGVIASALLVGMAIASSPALAQIKSTQTQRKEKMAQIPVCAKPLGAISVLEPENGTDWWSGQQLPAPSKLIKVFVSKSRCFTLVDRGAGMEAAMRERELASGGELRNRSNLGKGQIRAADYVMVPDLVGANSDSGGGGVTSLLGGLVGGAAGSVIGGLNFKKKTAEVVLTVTDVRSSEQVAMAEGSAKKTDLGFGVGSGGLFGGGGLGGYGVGGYANTELGQVITLAYLQAYTDLVGQLGGLPDNASEANASQAMRVTRPARLLGNAKGTGEAVRDLDPGALVYPTGNRDGAMIEVEDELGNRGWISSNFIELAK